MAAVTWLVARRPEPTPRMQFSLSGSDEMNISHMALSLDGSMLAFVSPKDRTGLGVLHVQRIGSRHLVVVPMAGGTANETNGQISYDGKWVAYASNESGAWETYVSSFPGAAGKWQVSRGDGKEIFYISPSGMLMAVPRILETASLRRACAAVSDSRARADLLHRHFYLRRQQGS